MIERIKNAVVRRYYRLAMSEPVASVRLSGGKHTFAKLASKLSGVEQKVVNGLRKDGLYVSSMDELFPDGVLWRAMQEEANTYKNRYANDKAFRESIEKGAQDPNLPKGSRKTFLTPLYGGGWVTPEIHGDSACMHFALSESIIRIAGNYIGVMPRFNSFNLSETVLITDEGDAKFSQRWHRDPEDRKLMKVFVYFTDVDEKGAGPFTYVKGAQEGGKYRHLFPQQFPQGSYPREGAVEKEVAPADIAQCFGKAGTVVFADTSGLHRGGLSTTKQRLMFTSSFVSDISPMPRKFTIEKQFPWSEVPPLVTEALRA